MKPSHSKKFQNARTMLLLALTSMALGACGAQPSLPNRKAKPSSAAAGAMALEANLNGTWIQEECKEGYVGEDAPPPEYSKGVMRFASDKKLFISSQVFDDSQCLAPRPISHEEFATGYSLPDFKTDDGSLALDIPWPTGWDDGSTFPMYALVKLHEGKLYMTLYQEKEKRPKTMDFGAATIFVMR